MPDLRLPDLTLGVIARTGKENERRVPLHPAQLGRIDADLRDRIYLEDGYGADFGVTDAELSESVAGVRSRGRLIAECDVILLIKPEADDLGQLRAGQVLWGCPTFTVGTNITYYAVDHSPSYLWNSATWEISEALLPYLRSVLAGPEGWDADPTIRRAIEIHDGKILNPNITSFQRRQAAGEPAV